MTGLQALEMDKVPVKPLINEAPLAEVEVQSVATDSNPIERESAGVPLTKHAMRYGPIKRSDTLWSIAASVRPDNRVSMEQVMLSIITANPDAFENSNLNILKKGVLLTIPSKSQMLVVSRRRAISEVEKQHQAWDGIKSKITGKTKLSTRHKSIAKTKPGKIRPKVIAGVNPRQNEIIEALKSDNSHLKKELKRLNEDKFSANKAYKKLQITLEQLLVTHKKLVKIHEILSDEASKAWRKLSDLINNNTSEASGSTDELINKNSNLLARVEQLVGEYTFLKNEYKARNSELAKVSKELLVYKKLAEETGVASETALMIEEWLSTPVIFYIILAILMFLLLLPWLLLMLCKRAGISRSSKCDKSDVMEVDLDAYEVLDDLEEEVISESDLEHMLSDSDKVGNKLDLARAYIDMGDSDGAKVILEEVMSEGSSQQQEEAKKIIAKL